MNREKKILRRRDRQGEYKALFSPALIFGLGWERFGGSAVPKDATPDRCPGLLTPRLPTLQLGSTTRRKLRTEWVLSGREWCGAEDISEEGFKANYGRGSR